MQFFPEIKISRSDLKDFKKEAAIWFWQSGRKEVISIFIIFCEIQIEFHKKCSLGFKTANFPKIF
jgi:hypothetical protein